MNWKQLIEDIRARGLTFQQIGDEIGMSKGSVHDLFSGRGKAVLYDAGVKLRELHKKIIRRKAKTK